MQSCRHISRYAAGLRALILRFSELHKGFALHGVDGFDVLLWADAVACFKLTIEIGIGLKPADSGNIRRGDAANKQLLGMPQPNRKNVLVRRTAVISGKFVGQVVLADMDILRQLLQGNFLRIVLLNVADRTLDQRACAALFLMGMGIVQGNQIDLHQKLRHQAVHQSVCTIAGFGPVIYGVDSLKEVMDFLPLFDAQPEYAAVRGIGGVKAQKHIGIGGGNSPDIVR